MRSACHASVTQYLKTKPFFLSHSLSFSFLSSEFTWSLTRVPSANKPNQTQFCASPFVHFCFNLFLVFFFFFWVESSKGNGKSYYFYFYFLGGLWTVTRLFSLSLFCFWDSGQWQRDLSFSLSFLIGSFLCYHLPNFP